MKAIRFSDPEVPRNILEKMKQTIEMSGAIGGECGFSWCKDGTVREMVCNPNKHFVVFPTCGTETRGVFHAHLSPSLSFSSIDLAAMLAVGNEIECIGAKDGPYNIKCIMKSSFEGVDPELKKRIKMTYKEMQNTTIEEFVNKIYLLAHELKKQATPFIKEKIFSIEK